MPKFVWSVRMNPNVFPIKNWFKQVVASNRIADASVEHVPQLFPDDR
ncbi:MAG: hypothetical protein OEZ57_01505 [Nitrospirota bacterium]|nr:hypothetical protein [Nitrospirota bacterium]MDH5585051.1 hypothetical protein [Nitrospirota bacterium]MDH5773576.1 hypothetical protein [Nitrospirota bacterium]